MLSIYTYNIFISNQPLDSFYTYNIKSNYIIYLFNYSQKDSMNKVSKVSLSLGLALATCLTLVNTANAAEITGTKRATVNWSGVLNAESYNIYYKEVSDMGYVHSVRDLSKDSRSYTIEYLKNNGNYIYKLCAVNGSKVEFWCSGDRRLFGKVATVRRVVATTPVVVSTTSQVVVPVGVAVGGGELVTVSKNYRQATVTWMTNPNAQHYYIYYKKASDATWTHSVFGMNADATNYTINYLDFVKYEYKVVALDGAFKPIAESAVYVLRTVPMRW